MTTKRPIVRQAVVTATVVGAQVQLWLRTFEGEDVGPQARKETRAVKMTLPVPPTNDEILQYCQEMARFCVDPAKRRFRPPRALVWRELPLGGIETREHGEERDGSPFPMDPLPLEGGFPEPPKDATILTAAKAEKSAPPKAASASAREPQIRNLGRGKRRSLPGG
jgi:hypothetical protein